MTTHTHGSTRDGVVELPPPELPSALPPGYVPLPYPAWRWHETTYDDIIVAHDAEDALKKAEGYTLEAPPVDEPTPVAKKKPEPKPEPEPEPRRRYGHTGD